ncbi:MAG TPA: SRPBCC family protein [Tardiphaga sp.]
MLKIIAVIAVILAVALVAVLALALTKPDTFEVARSAAIKAPPDRIYPLIEDLHRWTAWSPYEVKDPAMKRSYSGSERGKGAAYGWDGNNNVGAGRMEITDAASPTRIVLRLDFFRPFEGHNTGEFTLHPQGDMTTVTWSMRGPAPLMSKIMQVFLNMDEMIGKDFAVGLANLKSIVEK